MVDFTAYGNRVSPSQQTWLNDYKAMSTPKGSTYEQYMADTIRRQQSPRSPIQKDTRAIYDSDEGDKDYQMDELNRYYQSDAGKQNMSDFYQDNSSFYNLDGQRTNKGFNADDIEARDWLDSDRTGPNPVADRVSAYQGQQGAANAGTVAALRNPPQRVPETGQIQTPQPVRPPSQVQQNMNQPTVKKPVRNFNATQTANSGWTPGGWGQ